MANGFLIFSDWCANKNISGRSEYTPPHLGKRYRHVYTL